MDLRAPHTDPPSSRHRSVSARHLVPLLILLCFAGAPRQQELPATPDDAASATGAALRPTAHAPLPASLADLWLGPLGGSARSAVRSYATNLAAAADQLQQKKYAEALPLLQPEHFIGSLLGDYAAYYTGVAQMGLGQLAEARQTFAALRTRDPEGYLSEAVLLREGEVAEEQEDFDAALSLYGRLVADGSTAPDEALFRLGLAAVAAGDRPKAVGAFRSLYFRFPQSSRAAAVEAELAKLGDRQPSGESAADFELNLGRAEQLFGARAYKDARRVFTALRPHASGDTKELVAVRLGECDYYLKRYVSARTALEPYLTRGSRQDEAQFFYLSAARGRRAFPEVESRTRRLVRDFPHSSWAEEALNNLATQYILQDRDADAISVFREMLAKFPSGARAERAAWKLGWWAYETGALTEAVRVFERTAGAFPQSDNRPSFLYWAARAHEKLGNQDMAAARYALVLGDYRNTYYGRLAAGRVARHGRPAPAYRLADLDTGLPLTAGLGGTTTGQPPVAPVPTAPLIRSLLSLQLYDDAINELTYLQRTAGDSPAIQATLAWIHNQRGDLRRGINVMRRAYPQYMAAGGEDLPPEILKVLFPIDYWDLIRRHSVAQGLDPYLVAALVAQESTFLPAVRSPANAYGLMQILPSTGRRIARSLQIPRFSTRLLTNPETNVRIGTTYFARLSQKLGGVHLALASYNAGERRVSRWLAEKPDLEEDEFIDAIPFPETQNYVKRILGTAEDYRRLYGD
jgi:soluble lytic murein transglycosylase